jgi:hypothetical protein
MGAGNRCRTIVIAALLSVMGLDATARADVVAYWSFDEAAGAPVAQDLVGDADGNVAGSADFIPDGVSGNAISLSIAGGGYVNMGDVLPLGGVDFSISVWLRTAPNDQTDSYIPLSRHRAGVIAGYLLGVNANGGYGADDKAWFYPSVPPGDELISNAPVNDGAWHHVVVSYKANGLVRIYIDGAPVDNSQPASPIVPVGSPFLVGAVDFSGTPGATFNGFVDELQVYDHAVTDAEAQALFDDPTATVCPGDFDGDGLRDLADLGTLLASYGQDDGGDIDGDGDTDIGDLGALLADWQVDCPVIDQP